MTQSLSCEALFLHYWAHCSKSRRYGFSRVSDDREDTPDDLECEELSPALFSGGRGASLYALEYGRAHAPLVHIMNGR